MSYLEILPHPALRAYVDRFWVQAADVASPLEPQHVLPDGCIDVLVSLRQRSCHVVGTMTRALVVSQPAAATAAVRFRPGGAVAFLGVAAYELTDRYVPVDREGPGGQRGLPGRARRLRAQNSRFRPFSAATR